MSMVQAPPGLQTPAAAGYREGFDELLQRVANDLHAAMSMRSAELEDRDGRLHAVMCEKDILVDQVQELRMQVEMIRKAYVVTAKDLSTAQGQCETVQRELDSIKNNAPLVVALIDGDGTIFTEEYLVRGREGGRDAAHALNERILEACGDDAHRTGLRVLVNVYMNRSGMGRTLLRSGVCTSQDFFAFCEGFTQSSNLFCIVDVGEGKEAADGKIRDALQLYAAMPQVVRVFIGGTHDGGYCNPLSQLDGAGKYADKIVLVRGLERVAHDYSKLPAALLSRMVIWEDLFMKEALDNKSPRVTGDVVLPPPAPRTGPPPTSWATLAAIAPNAPPGLGPVKSTASPPGLKSPGANTYDNGLTSDKPRPCNMYHLVDAGACPFGNKCLYSHDPISAQEKELMLARTKAHPCDYVNRDTNCPNGNKCIYAHKCKGGRACPHFRRGTCKFEGEHMHE